MPHAADEGRPRDSEGVRRGALRENDPVKHNRASVTLPGYAGNVVSRDHRRWPGTRQLPWSILI